MRVNCSFPGCGAHQQWKPKGGPALNTVPCWKCGRNELRRPSAQAEAKRRAAVEAKAEQQAQDTPPQLPSEHQISYGTMKALERMATALEDLRDMGAEAGYAHGAIAPRAIKSAFAKLGVETGTFDTQAVLATFDKLRDHHEPAPGRVHAITSADPTERVKFHPLKGDRVWFGTGRFTDVTAVGVGALTVRECRGHDLYETALTREQWQAAVDIAERIDSAPEPEKSSAQKMKEAIESPAVELQTAGGAH